MNGHHKSRATAFPEPCHFEIGVGIAIARDPSSDPDGRLLARPVLFRG